MITLPSHTYLDEQDIPYERKSFPPETVKGAANVARALGFTERQAVKTLVFEADTGEKVLVMLGGDQSAISGHLKKAIGSRNIKMADPDAVKQTTGYVIGSIPAFGWQPSGFRSFHEASLLDEPILGTGAGVWGEEIMMTPEDLILASDEARRAVGLVRDRVTWKGCGPPEADSNPFFAGEVEPCINGQVGAVGAYFGQDTQSGDIVDRLLAEQLPDGGWNCEAANGSTRSSFHTTICVLEALLEHELRVGSRPELTGARLRGQEYLLERRLFRRRSTGEVIEDRKARDASGTRFAFPTWWHYDVLRGLEYLRRASVAPDVRVAEAIDLVVSKRDGDGRWPLEVRYPGNMPVEIDEGVGRPSRWNTLRALRVLDWYSARD